MVGIFAGLKWRLLTGRWKSVQASSRAWTIVGWAIAALISVGIAIGLAVSRATSSAPAVATAFFTAQFLAWGIGPLVALGVDETVDPAKFALLPLTTSTLQRGLTVASLIGPLPAANALALIGMAIGLSTPWSLLPVALLAVAVQLALCVFFSRALSTAMSGLMSGRRGRDIGVMVGFSLFLVYMGVSLLLNSSSRASSFGSGLSRVNSVLAYGPNGSLAAIPSAVAEGRWIRVLVASATALAVLALLWVWWSRALTRSLTSVPSTTAGSAPAGPMKTGRFSATSVLSTAAVVAGRDRLLAWRDPMRRLPWLMVVVFALLWPFLVVHGRGSLLAVVFAALMAGTQAGNQFGMDGSALWLNMVAFGDRRRARGEVLGHVLFAVIPGVVIITAGLLLQAFLRGDQQLLPAGFGLCLAALAGSVGTAGYLSARSPFAVRQSRKSMFANGISNQKGRTAAVQLGLMGGGLLTALIPAGFAVLALTIGPIWGWAALLAGLIIGGLTVWWLSFAAARLYLQRSPEILETVSIGDRS